MLRYGVTLSQVRKAVQDSNQNATGGYLDQQGPNELLVRALGRVQSIEDLQKVVVTIRDGRPVSDSELSAAQANLTRSLPGENETTSALASTLTDSVVFNLPDDYYEGYVRRIRDLDDPALTKAAQSMIDTDGLTWVVVGDLNQIETAIRELGWGKVQTVDPTTLETSTGDDVEGDGDKDE